MRDVGIKCAIRKPVLVFISVCSLSPLLSATALAESGEDLSGAIGSWDTNTEIHYAGRNLEGVGDQFESFIAQILEHRTMARSTVPLSKKRAVNFSGAWWRSGVRKPIDHVHGQHQVRLNSIIDRALQHSTQLQVFARIPAIRETGIAEAEGRYRPEVYAEVKKERRNDPSNSFSQAQGFSRYIFDEAAAEVGVRSRLKSGAEVALSHRKSDYKTNATEYDPKEQDRNKTSLSLVQPLLRNGGFTHHRRIIRVAELDGEVAMNEMIRQAEQHLLEVVRAYWTVYRTRAVYFQKERLAKSAGRVVNALGGRANIDVDPVQVSRARSAEAARAADLLRARTAIKNAELRLKALVNDPALDGLISHEIIVGDKPNSDAVHLNRRQLLREAFEYRPELRQAFAQYRASVLREGLAWNEALPQLDLILDGSYHTGDNEKLFAPNNRTPDSKYGWAVGLRFSMPIGVDERKARYNRRRIETTQQEYQVRTAIETVALELEVSINEFEVSQADIAARMNVLRQAQRELKAIQARWSSGRGMDSGLVLLTELLDAQERLQRAEEDAVNSEVALAVARENLKRARGGYLQELGIVITSINEDIGRKSYQLERNWNY